uniref:Family with sequence similarity 111 member B n=1 Tax=Sus scrofa TaxID=9823 RepID=A0A8D1VXU4_PIG
MNFMKAEENKSFSTEGNDLSTGPEISKDTTMQQTCSDTPADQLLANLQESIRTIKIKSEVSEQKISPESQNPHLSTSKKSFTFMLQIGSRKSDQTRKTAHGGLNENIDSALKNNEHFRRHVQDPFKWNIMAYEETTIKGFVNLGMPLRCLPEKSHFKITIVPRKSKQENYDPMLRLCENPDIECILFHVLSIGKNIKKIVKIMDLHEKGSKLCVYAFKGETIKEALCKDGRFRSDLDSLEWELVEGHQNVHGKESTVDQISGKLLEMEVLIKKDKKKGTGTKIKQRNENATDEINHRDSIWSKSTVHEPGPNGETEDTEHNREKILPFQSLESKKHRTISEIKGYYDGSFNTSCMGETSQVRLRSPLPIECAFYTDRQKEATNSWKKNVKILGKAIMHRYPFFNEEVLRVRKYLEEEQKRNLPPFEQFNIYKEYFGKVTENSTSVETCERLIHHSESVGFMKWDVNGNSGSATCFVIKNGYIFTCRHVLDLILRDSTNPSLQLDIISSCVKVTFSYKSFCPKDNDWFSLEKCFAVSDETLDYAILKLSKNGHRFPPGLFQHVSPQPSGGLIYLIGHPEGQIKKIDGCMVIPLEQRLESYPENHRDRVAGTHAPIYNACPVLTQRSFLTEAWSRETLSYDTCFSSGSSGSPVFNASGRLVAMHSFGHFYRHENKVYALIEFGYSMDSILSDIKQKHERLYKLLEEEENENHEEERENTRESSLRDHQVEPMEH